MSGDLFAYRSDKPEVITAWKTACDAVDEYIAKTNAVLEDAGLGDRQVYRDSGGSRIGRFAGIAVPDREKPPAGWRISPASYAYAVPDRRYRAGREVKAALDAVAHPGSPSGRMPGMPPYLLARGRHYQAGIRLIENESALYVTWGTDPEALESPVVLVDSALWERIPLSRYYAAVESADAAEADGGDRS